MAINPSTKYPGRTTAPNADYPFGGGQNESVDGADDGTPLEITQLNDFWGLLQVLLSLSGQSPDGNPDTAQASQYLQALHTMVGLGDVYRDNSAISNFYEMESVGDRALPPEYELGLTVRFMPHADNTAAAQARIAGLANLGIHLQAPPATAAELEDLPAGAILEDTLQEMTLQLTQDGLTQYWQLTSKASLTDLVDGSTSITRSIMGEDYTLTIDPVAGISIINTTQGNGFSAGPTGITYTTIGGAQVRFSGAGECLAQNTGGTIKTAQNYEGMRYTGQGNQETAVAFNKAIVAVPGTWTQLSTTGIYSADVGLLDLGIPENCELLGVQALYDSGTAIDRRIYPCVLHGIQAIGGTMRAQVRIFSTGLLETPPTDTVRLVIEFDGQNL